MSTVELFLIAMTIIFAVPYLIWRLGRTDYYAPLVVVQILTGILLGPGLLGALFPVAHETVFNPQVIQSLNGIAWWAVMMFVCLAGIELDLGAAWRHRRESLLVAGLALGTPLLIGALAALGLLLWREGWLGASGSPWQFTLGIGMSCAVTALPILILLMEKIGVFRTDLGQRVLRYASLDDIAIWAVLALILMDYERLTRQLLFFLGFVPAALLLRALMPRVPAVDRLYLSLIWLSLVALGADWAGLHFMVGAFLAGVVMDADWFGRGRLDHLRQTVLLLVMPVFFLSTGLRTDWEMGGVAVLLAAALLLMAQVLGKLLGVHIAGRLLRWPPGEASVIAWLLQTKALIMIIFANVLLDKAIISSETFTALLLMAVASTMLTIPLVQPKLSVLQIERK